MFSKRVYTAVAALFWLAEPATCSPCCNKLPASTYKLAVDNYLKAWNGENKEIVPKSFTKFALLSGDRLLNGTSPSFSPYPIVTSDGISQFMDMARVGWDKYQFELIHWAGGIDNTAAVRWTLHGVLGKDYQAKAEITKKAGATISYNGTDFLQLDPCSGLIQQVDMTQDYMNFYHELGATTLHL